ncbi:MAG: elongation factor G [Erysipelotrichales bacterium]|nr:elongation factor G [Erysipelotrichales bacterium]MBQ4375872.1 elongation factor G [Erysipelotrichales bacterium]
MKDYTSDKIRNVVLLGHRGSGKTTAVEAMLHYTKQTDRMGKTVDGNSAMDYDSEEVKRGMSIYTSLCPIEWKDCKINFIDTPGYNDFAGEQAAGLEVADSALIFVSAKDGVEPGTDKAWKEICDRKIPTAFVVNKLDEEHTSFEKAYDDIRDTFGSSVVPFEMPIMEGNALKGWVNVLKNEAYYYNDPKTAKEVPSGIADTAGAYHAQISEAIASADEELMEKFFMEEPFTDEEIAKGVKEGLRSGEIHPVYCGAMIKEAGVESLMDMIINYMPAYTEKGTVTAFDGTNPVEMKTTEDEKVSAFIFKSIADPFAGRISLMKVMSGVLSGDSQVYNANKDRNEKIAQLFVMRGKTQLPVNTLHTGDIGAVVKLSSTETCDTLCAKELNIHYPAIKFPEAMLGMATWPKTRADEDKFSQAIQKIMEEDKTCKLENNVETHEQVLYGLGDQHVDVIKNKLSSKYKVEIDLTTPKVQYRETIRGKAEAQGKHKKQTGGAGQYGDVWVRFEPTESEEMEFGVEVVGGAVPKQYYPAVEKGLRECMLEGPLAGYKMVGVKAVLYDGSYHPVDSKEVAFVSAAHLAYKAAMPKCKPVILEPIVEMQVTVPDDYTGTIIGDLTKRRGMIMGQEAEGKLTVIKAEVPQSEVMVYSTELRAMTQGVGIYSQKFLRYDPAPANVQEKVIAEAKKAAEEKK